MLTRTHLHRQRGVGLIEALIAFLVLSLGMLAVGRFQSQLRLHADIARQRSEAVRLAQLDLERLRAFSFVAATAGARAYADIASATSNVDASTRFVVSRSVDEVNAPRARNASVDVGWTDSSGAAQHVVLNSIVSGGDPAHSGALALAPSGPPGPFARSVRVPLSAQDLGNGSSVFKPTGSEAWVFSNRTGEVIARCTGIAPTTTAQSLTPADLNHCDTAPGLLLSGHVRFASNDRAPAFGMQLVLSGGNYAKPPACTTEASAGSEPDTSYHCIVYPLANTGIWSGRLSLTPIGWTVGAGEADRRVCRYASDLDGSGAVDSNIELPADYSGVAGALTHQNFVIVKGTQNCPLGTAEQTS